MKSRPASPQSSTEHIEQEINNVKRNYTRAPNILFDSYDELRPQEKWLYINLVYLCGARGTRYLSIRYISERTGISNGALSGSKDLKKNDPGMIRRLHDAQLIHAEKKRMARKDGTAYGQEQYHITIVDIWQLNELYFTQKRSENEHPEEKGTAEGVQNSNTSVQNSNAPSRERSENERERSENDTNIRLDSKTINSKTTEVRSYTPTDEQLSFPLTAAVVSLTQLENLSTEELAYLKAKIDTLMVKQQDTNTTDQVPPPFKEIAVAPYGQNDQKEQIIDEGVEGLEESPKFEKPREDAPRTAETVVQLIEYLRGMPYEPKAYAFELRKAALLLGLKEVPGISLAEIEEAWLHGSDDYWREKHDGDDLHVHDLINKDSKGRYRIQAFLAHKRAQDRQQQKATQTGNSRGTLSSAPVLAQTPVAEQSTLSEEQAQDICSRIAQDAQEHGLSALHGELQVNGTGWLVRVSWRSSYWNGDMGLMISSEQQWQHEFREWNALIKLREQRRQMIEAKGQEVSGGTY